MYRGFGNFLLRQPAFELIVSWVGLLSTWCDVNALRPKKGGVATGAGVVSDPGDTGMVGTLVILVFVECIEVLATFSPVEPGLKYPGRGVSWQARNPS